MLTVKFSAKYCKVLHQQKVKLQIPKKDNQTNLYVVVSKETLIRVMQKISGGVKVKVNLKSSQNYANQIENIHKKQQIAILY